jgi:hypothetical protein
MGLAVIGSRIKRIRHYSYLAATLIQNVDFSQTLTITAVDDVTKTLVVLNGFENHPDANFMFKLNTTTGINYAYTHSASAYEMIALSVIEYY